MRWDDEARRTAAAAILKAIYVVMLIAYIVTLIHCCSTKAPAPPPAGEAGPSTVEPDKPAEPMANVYIPPEPEPEKLPLEPLIVIEPASPVRYYLTDGERDIVERVVMAEAGAEDYDGQRLVAQCILVSSEAQGVVPSVAMVRDRYTQPHDYASQSVKDAVSAVFDRGDLVTQEPIRVFYAPRLVCSAYHESQTFVLEHGGHRFFKLKEADRMKYYTIRQKLTGVIIAEGTCKEIATVMHWTLRYARSVCYNKKGYTKYEVESGEMDEERSPDWRKGFIARWDRTADELRRLTGLHRNAPPAAQTLEEQGGRIRRTTTTPL